jgi:Raf kinase inhibitor-like YbhB/YbcL family protein
MNKALLTSTILALSVITTMTTSSAYADDIKSATGFTIQSTRFKEGDKINPKHFWNQFGCSGDNARPELSWSGAPKDTKSFAITYYDKDAPTGSGFWHWVAYDIPVSTSKIIPTEIPKGTIEANTDIGKPGFFAPCPPSGRVHTYTFTLHAMSTDKLNVPEGASGAIARFFIENNTIAKATISATAGPRK